MTRDKKLRGQIGKNSLAVVGLICITILELYALRIGIDGILFSGVIAVIAGAIGVKIDPPHLLRFEQKEGDRQGEGGL